MEEQTKLQESRKKSIPVLVEKYQKLIDKIFDVVTQELPGFNDVTKDVEGGDPITITAEQQMFSFINVRNRALDNANDMMLKINLLEMELNAPELYEMHIKIEAEEKIDQPVIKQNPTKRHAQKPK